MSQESGCPAKHLSCGNGRIGGMGNGNPPSAIPELSDAIEAAIRMAIDLRNEALERVVEQAVQGGQYGVLIVRNADGSEAFEVSAEVPYGFIHEYMQGRADHA